MRIPYRTQRALKRLAVVLLVVLLVAVLVWLCWILWLGRYVVYTRDGAKLDFSKNAQTIEGQSALETEPVPTVKIYAQETTPEDAPEQLTQIGGYSVSAEDLQTRMDAVLTAVSQLEPGTAVMVDVKTIHGSFNYDSQISDQRNSDVDTQKMNELITAMNDAGLYTIARVPALRDYHYGLHHVDHGLPTSGGYLWMDSDGCYWLNPASEGTVSYLISILNELKGLGFDEVVFYDFRFPETDSIVFNSDRTEALTSAANALVNACGSREFTVSFVAGADFTLPNKRSRLFMSDVAAADLQQIVTDTAVELPEAQLVFLTDLHDTRFDTYSVLRPLQIED